MRRRQFLKSVSLGAVGLALGKAGSSAALARPGRQKRPNILWICIEDMSPNMSCYGETTIATPNIDRLAREGTRFTRAFITCPVCSPSRSAMITGMYQTSTGTHNHRSSRHAAQISLPRQIRLIPEYFQQAGYYTCNGRMFDTKTRGRTRPGKTDYNFVWDKEVYDAPEWSGRKAGQPFFAQIQLHGGKNRKAKVPNPVDPADVTLPPYYPDDPVLREDWARYLNSVLYVDLELGKIMERLEDEGIADDTVVFFWTDHGISHVRDKQFLYEGGIHIPLIVHGPHIRPTTTREDLVVHIDIPATSMHLAGIPIPKHIQGRALFASDYQERDCIFAARDRCDETVERIRCVRTKRYKYIRNYYPNRAHTQPNRYKNNKEIMIRMRELYAEGKLSPHQARVFWPYRPVEELYDLQDDPHEMNNLANSRAQEETLVRLRGKLEQWIGQTGDLGQFPEPVLDEMLQKYDSLHAILQDRKNRRLAERVSEVWDLGCQGQQALPGLIGHLESEDAPVRYAAAYWLGNLHAAARPAYKPLSALTNDDTGYVRVAAARALGLMGKAAEALPVLVEETSSSSNEATRHYAALALEDLGDDAQPALEAIRKAAKDKYDCTHRVAARIVDALGG
ncbi:MAG: sulfatase-like hydrolase/transferase [Sedimentisphaerales bacterium]|nr:sulfatase-like hydrolase/transferase [Sedimentisphaerales bacterium]